MSCERESGGKGWPRTLGLLAMTDMDRQIKGQTKPIIMQTDALGPPVVVGELQEGLLSLDLGSQSPRGRRRALLVLNACLPLSTAPLHITQP